MQIRTLVSFILYIGGTVMLVSGVLNPPKEFLIAVAGSAAVALGFALKDVAASLVSGVILLFDRPFQVGDRVTFNDIYGEITAITLRSVRLQTLDDNIVTIPNARFITDVVSSGNMGMMDMMVVTDFHLALDADLEQAKDIVRQVIVTSRFAYLKKDGGFTMQEVEVAKRLAIRLRSMAYVFDVKYEKIFQSDITNRVTHLFREAEVKRPMSH
jgi:small-conductance mechanosensitive channel